MIQLGASADTPVESNNPWVITVQGETLDYNIKEGQLDLGQDSSGDIAFHDGSELQFENVEKLIW